MAQYRFQVEFESELGLAKDRVVNTLHYICADDAAAVLCAGAISTAYGSVLTGQTNGLTEYYSRTIQRPGAVHVIRVYDLADPTPRVPIWEQPMSVLDAQVNDGLPREVALCLSYQGERQSGVNQRRRRGRIYLGPFNTAVLGGAGPDADARPNPTFLDDVLIFGDALIDNPHGELSVKSTFSAVLIPVTDGWVDDAFDTMRSRGADPTTRYTFNGA